MEDYKEEIRNLLLKYYEVAGKETKKIQRSTAQILAEVRGVIPAEPIGEHEIYEVMKALNFEQELKIFYEKICTISAEVESGKAAQFEKIEAGRVYLWNLYEKD